MKGVLFSCQKLKEGKDMTDVCCHKRQCLNNRKGWCVANAISLDSQCQSYVTSNRMMVKQCAKVRKDKGKYKTNDNIVLK